MKKPNKKYWGLMILFLLLAPVLASHGEDSLSEVVIEELEKDFFLKGGRNPFSPATLEGEIDFNQLSLEGLVLGPNVQLALLSGRILQEGNKLGPYEVSQILPGKITFTKEGREQTIKMQNYLPPLQEERGGEYSIEFRNADIKDSLKILAKAAGYNLIMPEDLIGRVNLSFENTPLRTAIRAILKVNNYSFAMENGVMRVGTSEQFSGGTDLQALTLPLKYATAKDLTENIKPLLSDKGSVTAEVRTNAVTVKDYDANIENVRNLIESVDKKDQLVHIEAHIIDATNDFSRSLGIQWGASGTPSRLTVAGGDTTGNFTVGSNAATKSNVNLGAASPTSALAMRIGRLAGGSAIDLQLTAAEQRGSIRILSKPSVTTINNKPAKIRSGVKIYVKSTSNISVGTSGASASGSDSSLQTIETGVTLNVTPQISPNEMIKLTIEANESEADFSRTVDGIPAVLDNTATTTVVLENGETAVIGGLIKRKEQTTKKRVPGLGQIPVLGLFFKSKTKTDNQNELMIFITPRILD